MIYDENIKKYTLVTGATSGIGYELAKLFAQNRHNLIMVARDEQNLESTAAELTQKFGVDIVQIPKDLSIPQNAFDLYNEVLNQELEVDILVNDAGQGQ